MSVGELLFTWLLLRPSPPHCTWPLTTTTSSPLSSFFSLELLSTMCWSRAWQQLLITGLLRILRTQDQPRLVAAAIAAGRDLQLTATTNEPPASTHRHYTTNILTTSGTPNLDRNLWKFPQSYLQDTFQKHQKNLIDPYRWQLDLSKLKTKTAIRHLTTLYLVDRIRPPASPQKPYRTRI